MKSSGARTMSVVQRHLLAAAGLVCLAVLCPERLSAQQRGRPNADTPRLLIATFRSADARIGVQGAAAVRDRVQRESRPEDLWVIPRDQMNDFLIQSGFSPDSALSLDDLKLLAQRFRADAIVDGVVTKTASGVALNARYVLPSNLALIQPLPTIEAPTLEQAAKELERRLTEVQRSLLDFRKCSNAVAAAKYDEARAAAREGIARFPASTLSRLCLMDAYARERQPTDSIVRAAQAVLRIDSTSTLALMNLVTSYEEMHDTTNAIDAMLKLVVYRPDLRPDAIRKLGQMNRPRLALPLVAEMLRENPGDAALLKQRWLLLLAVHQWKDALRAGEDLVRSDSSAANADYFTRSIAAAAADSQSTLAAEIAARAVSKFPGNASLWAMAAQTQRKAGRSPDAVSSIRRALALDSTTENGWQLLIVAQIELDQTDSAIASARLAIVRGADKASIGRILQLPITTTAKRANESKSREGWLDLVRIASTVDSIAPSAGSKYFIAIGAYSVGMDLLVHINDNKKCDEAKLAEDMWAIASINAPAGAQAGPDQRQVVTQIMTSMQQNGDAIVQAKKLFCRKR
jgi:tetratricopeptide (TPR) repeat protein